MQLRKVKKLHSTGAAAGELGVTDRTLRYWVAQGLLEPDTITLGGHYRWDLDRLRKRQLTLAGGRDDGGAQ